MSTWRKVKEELRKSAQPDESLWVTQALMERRKRYPSPRRMEWVEGVATAVGFVLFVAVLAFGGPLFF